MAEQPPILQVVDAEGDYNVDGVENFSLDSGLDSCGVDYQMVAVMGPQSSGKSTLMNAVVGVWFIVSYYECYSPAPFGDWMYTPLGAVWDAVSGDGCHERPTADDSRHLASQVAQDSVAGEPQHFKSA